MLKLKQGNITADRYGWILTMFIPVDKERLIKGKVPKSDFSEYQTYYGTLEQAVSSYCDLALLPVEEEVKVLLQRLETLTEEIRSMNLTQYKRY